MYRPSHYCLPIHVLIVAPCYSHCSHCVNIVRVYLFYIFFAARVNLHFLARHVSFFSYHELHRLQEPWFYFTWSACWREILGGNKRGFAWFLLLRMFGVCFGCLRVLCVSSIDQAIGPVRPHKHFWWIEDISAEYSGLQVRVLIFSVVWICHALC